MSHFGIYVGEVIDTADPEQRFRVKVRVSGVHHPDAPVEGIDYAEVMFPGAVSSLGGAGDFRPYAVGDWVIVQFLSGNPAQPVVMGSFTAPVGGIPAAPLTATSEPDKAARRWVRKDRAGNEVTLSENPDEQHVRITSGGAELIVSRIGDRIAIRALRGEIALEAANVQVRAGASVVQSNEVTIIGDGENVLGVANGKVKVESNDRIDVIAADPIFPVPTPVSTSQVNIGGRTDSYRGVPVPPPTGRAAQQTQAVNVRSQEIHLGVGAGSAPSDFDHALPLLPTLNITVRAVTGVSIRTAGFCSVDATSVALTAVDVTIAATATMTLKTIGQVAIEAAGAVALRAGGPVTVQGSALSFLSTPAAPPVVVPPAP